MVMSFQSHVYDWNTEICSIRNIITLNIVMGDDHG